MHSTHSIATAAGLLLAAARPPPPSLLSYRHYTCSHRAYLRAHTHPVTTLATS